MLGDLTLLFCDRKEPTLLIIKNSGEVLTNYGANVVLFFKYKKNITKKTFKIKNRIEFLKEINSINFVCISNAPTAEKIIKNLKPNISYSSLQLGF